MLYIIYVLGKPKGLIVAAQALHGLAYVMFMIVGQVYAATVAPEAIRSSMQALIFAATTGVGLFLGSQLAGAVMDGFSAEGKFQWRKIWSVPLVGVGASGGGTIRALVVSLGLPLVFISIFLQNSRMIFSLKRFATRRFRS